MYVSRPLDLSDVAAELFPREAGSSLGAHARVLQFIDALIEVEAQLALQIAVHTSRADGVPQATEPFTQVGRPERKEGWRLVFPALGYGRCRVYSY
jgi:hypothetical protein